MPRFALLKRTIGRQKDGLMTITFTTIKMPLGEDSEVIIIEAEDATVAARNARDLLGGLGVKTHYMIGNPEWTLTEEPRFFVTELRDVLDCTLHSALHGVNFIPIKKD